MKNIRRPLAAFLAAVLLAGCARQAPEPRTATSVATAEPALAGLTAATAAGLSETFETGTKTAYTSGSVTLGSGAWTLNDALLGNTTADAKTGSQSARVRNSGLLGMNFDLSGGAGVVTVAHARYGTDASGTWELWASGNGGSSYAKVGSTITSSSTALSTASFTVKLAVLSAVLLVVMVLPTLAYDEPPLALAHSSQVLLASVP